MEANGRTIKVGIIGPGGVGYTHIESLKRLKNVEIIGIAANGADRAEFYRKKHNIANVYSDYRRLVDEKKVEVIHVATPNYHHYQQVKYAIESGKHVICDKPLAMNEKETVELLSLATRKGIVHAVNFNFRYFPLVQQAKAICKKQELGEIFLIRGGSLSDDFLWPSDYNWRMDRKKGGSSLAVSTIGCHWLDLIQFVSELKIEAVLADFKNVWPIRIRSDKTSGGKVILKKVQCPLEECASILLRLNNNKTKGNATISLASAGRKFEFCFEMSGSKGSIYWSLPEANVLWRGYRGKPNQVILRDPLLLTAKVRSFTGSPSGELEGYADSFKQHFKTVYDYIERRDYLKGKKPCFPTFKDAHDIQTIMDAIVASAKENRWIEVKGAKKGKHNDESL
jgi:predicted dehydrogenase